MKKVLLIENDPFIGDLLEKKLRKIGYYVFRAEDGEAGLREIKEKNPQLILLDMLLPRLSGLDVLKRMKEEDLFSKHPVIVISNSGQAKEIDQVRVLGAKDWIIKTEFDPAEALEKVRQQIGQADETKIEN